MIINDNKKCESCGIKYKDCECFLEYTSFKDNSIAYKCLSCNKNHQKRFDEYLKKRFVNAYKFCNHEINKFTLLLWKGVYPYKYIDERNNSMKHH